MRRRRRSDLEPRSRPQDDSPAGRVFCPFCQSSTVTILSHGSVTPCRCERCHAEFSVSGPPRGQHDLELLWTAQDLRCVLVQQAGLQPYIVQVRQNHAVLGSAFIDTPADAPAAALRLKAIFVDRTR